MTDAPHDPTHRLCTRLLEVPRGVRQDPRVRQGQPGQAPRRGAGGAHGGRRIRHSAAASKALERSGQASVQKNLDRVVKKARATRVKADGEVLEGVI